MWVRPCLQQFPRYQLSTEIWRSISEFKEGRCAMFKRDVQVMASVKQSLNRSRTTNQMQWRFLNSMEQSPSSEANRSSATQEIPRILCNIHKRRPHVRNLSQRISPSPRSCEIFRNISSFYGEELLAPRPTHKLRTTHCPMSATAYSIYPQLLCVSGGRSSVRSL